MTAHVPYRRGRVNVAAVASGAPVSAVTWGDVALLANHALGRGAMLVPWFDPDAAISAGQTQTFRFRTRPRLQGRQRLWMVIARSASGFADESEAIEIRTPAGTGTAQTYGARTAAGTTPVFHEETVASPAASEAEISISIKNSSPASQTQVSVQGIACVEVPRATLVIATESGVDLTTVRARQPIFDGNYKSLTGTVDAVVDSFTVARRASLFQFARDTTAPLTTTTGPSWATLITGKPIILTRKLYSGSTTGVVSWKVYARATDGTTSGEVRATMTSGGASTLTIPAGTSSFTWIGGPGTFSADCEDMAVADGRRSGRYDEATLEFRRTAGAGTIEVASISMWEDNP